MSFLFRRVQGSRRHDTQRRIVSVMTLNGPGVDLQDGRYQRPAGTNWDLQ